MPLWRQLLISVLVLAGVTFAWISYVPAALPFLGRAGVLSLLDITPQVAQEAQASGGQRARGGPVQVIASRVEARALADDVTAIGDGRALRNVTLRSEVAGRVVEISPPPVAASRRGT